MIGKKINQSSITCKIIKSSNTISDLIYNQQQACTKPVQLQKQIFIPLNGRYFGINTTEQTQVQTNFASCYQYQKVQKKPYDLPTKNGSRIVTQFFISKDFHKQKNQPNKEVNNNKQPYPLNQFNPKNSTNILNKHNINITNDSHNENFIKKANYLQPISNQIKINNFDKVLISSKSREKQIKIQQKSKQKAVKLGRKLMNNKQIVKSIKPQQILQKKAIIIKPVKLTTSQSSKFKRQLSTKQRIEQQLKQKKRKYQQLKLEKQQLRLKQIQQQKMLSFNQGQEQQDNMKVIQNYNTNQNKQQFEKIQDNNLDQQEQQDQQLEERHQIPQPIELQSPKSLQLINKSQQQQLNQTNQFLSQIAMAQQNHQGQVIQGFQYQQSYLEQNVQKQHIIDYEDSESDKSLPGGSQFIVSIKQQQMFANKHNKIQAGRQQNNKQQQDRKNEKIIIKYEKIIIKQESNKRQKNSNKQLKQQLNQSSQQQDEQQNQRLQQYLKKSNLIKSRTPPKPFLNQLMQQSQQNNLHFNNTIRQQEQQTQGQYSRQQQLGCYDDSSEENQRIQDSSQDQQQNKYNIQQKQYQSNFCQRKVNIQIQNQEELFQLGLEELLKRDYIKIQ